MATLNHELIFHENSVLTQLNLWNDLLNSLNAFLKTVSCLMYQYWGILLQVFDHVILNALVSLPMSTQNTEGFCE